MFVSIQYKSYDPVKQCNIFSLRDTCFKAEIASPTGSPSIAAQNTRISNTITLLSIVKHYDTIHRNVPLNLAYYYAGFLSQRFNITPNFIREQFELVDRSMPNMNFMQKYYHAVMMYINDAWRGFPVIVEPKPKTQKYVDEFRTDYWGNWDRWDGV